jgi:hypothetical protein
MTRLTNMDNTVNIIVRRGVIDGSMLCSSSPTMPAVKAASLATLLIDRPKYDPILIAILSAKLYNAQKLGAQYAWVNPRLNGNSLDKT